MQGGPQSQIKDPVKIDEYWQPWVLGQLLTDGTRKCVKIVREPPEPNDVYDAVFESAEADDDSASYIVVPLKDAILLGYEGIPQMYHDFLPNYKPGDWYRLWEATKAAEKARARAKPRVKKEQSV